MKYTLSLLPVLIVAVIAGVSFLHSRAAPREIGTEPSIVSFTATPPVAHAGEPVVLAWNARGANSLTLDWSTRSRTDASEPDRTRLPNSGRIVVHPKQDTVYTLTCETAQGPMCSREVSVRAN